APAFHRYRPCRGCSVTRSCPAVTSASETSARLARPAGAPPAPYLSPVTGGEGSTPHASPDVSTALLVEQRDAQEHHAEDQAGQDAVHRPDIREIDEQHLQNGEPEQSQRGVADGRARADEAPGERRPCVQRPEHGEAGLAAPTAAAPLV